MATLHNRYFINEKKCFFVVWQKAHTAQFTCSSTKRRNYNKQRWIQRGVWGGAHPPKIFQNAATRGSGGGGGRWWGVNCVIVTIKCIVILGILIFFLSIQTLNHDIYFSDFDSQ